MTSGTPFPHNLTEIDPLTRPDHSYLGEDDRCFFLGEYTARKGFAYSDTNNLILNLKKGMDRRNRPEWPHKGKAIRMAARALRNAINDSWLDSATFVPIPPSKARDDPMYDDRMTQVLRGMRTNPSVDFRELIVQCESTGAVHDSTDRLGPTEIFDLYTLDADLLAPAPTKIVVVDDVLTTGAHFRAAQRVLHETFDVPIVGCFIARRVPEAIDFETFFENLDN